MQPVHASRICLLLTLVLVLGAALAQDGGVAHDDPNHHGPPAEIYDGPGWTAGSGSDLPINFHRKSVQLLAWLPIPEFGEHQNANTCAGYVSPTGREYAVLGLSGGTGFVEVTDPANPVVIGVVPGPESLWRDMKVYQHYCYAVSEGGGGIQVIDLSQIDDGIVEHVQYITEGGTLATESTHTVALDADSGYLYRSGGGTGTIGVRMYSLADPVNPTFVGEWHDRYVHEAQVVTFTAQPYAGMQIAYLSANDTSGGGNPRLDILDVTDKSNPVILGEAEYSWPGFAHQSWLSKNKRLAYLNDELGELIHGIPTTTRIIDVSDVSNPYEIGTFTNNYPAIGHNLYTRGDYIFAANYRSGLRVFDASNPVAPVEIAFFDTWPQDNNPAFNGLWDNYPFLPSGVILGSDIEKGLFLWRIIKSCDEDFVEDGFVNGLDLLYVLTQWGPCPRNGDCPADLNQDGVVNGLDLVTLLSAWGMCPEYLDLD